MDSLKSVATLGRRRERCGSGNPSIKSNLPFTDTGSLESIFLQLAVNPVGQNKSEGLGGPKHNRSSEPRILKVARKSFDTLDVGVTRQHERHLKVNPELVAQQLTLIELKLFKAIQPEEFMSLKWNSKEKMKCAPNIVASTRWFNQIIFWVQKDLLHEENLSRRAEVLSHFVRIAKKLVDLNNYSSAMAVVSGLLVQSIYRLSATWAALSSRDRSSFRKLSDLFSQDQNFTNLRTAIDTARLPCIPYLGIYLSDLTYIDVAAATANQHENGGSWGNDGRQKRMNNLLRIIANFQQSNYPFVRNEKIASYLESQRYIEELQRFIEDNNYKLSLKLEPPSGETSSSAPSESIYPFPVKTNWFTSTVLKPVPVSTGPQDARTLDRRPALLPSQSIAYPPEHMISCPLNDMHSTHSSPLGSISRRPHSPIQAPLIPPPPPVRAKSGRDRSTPLVPDHSDSQTSSHVSGGHRRLGSWTAMGYNADSTTRDDSSSTIPTFLKDLPFPPRHRDRHTGNSSWSASSGSMNGRTLLAIDHPVPVQQPLGPLLDQTDLTTSTTQGILSSDFFTQESIDSSPSALTSRHSSTRSNYYPKALTTILPNHPRVILSCPVPSPLTDKDGTSAPIRSEFSPHEKADSNRMLPEKSPHTPLSSPRPNVNRSVTSVNSALNTQPRLRHSASQPRSFVKKTVSDRRVRNNSPKEATEVNRLRCRSSRSTATPSVSGHSRKTTPTQITDSALPKTKEFGIFYSCSPKFDTASRPQPATLPSGISPLTCSTCSSGDCLFRFESSSSAYLPKAHPHSTTSPHLARSFSSIISAAQTTVQSHLAQAALAAVQGFIADELARIASAENRISSVHNILPLSSNLVSPTKAVCLDVQLANGLRVLREGVIWYGRCSTAAFKRAQLVPTSLEVLGSNDTACTWYGSCDALDALRSRTSSQIKLDASFTKCVCNDRQKRFDQLGLSSLNLLTLSPTQSLTSLDLDEQCISSNSSSSFSGESVADLPLFSTTVEPLASSPANQSTSPNCVPFPRLSPGTIATNRRWFSWFNRLFFATYSDSRAKLRWGVLIQSDAKYSPAFLVLFKRRLSVRSVFHPPQRHHNSSVSGPVELLASPTTVPIRQNSKHVRKLSDTGTWKETGSYMRMSPEMFSTGNCKVLAISTALVDHQSAHTPSVLVSDLINTKHKVYRLSSGLGSEPSNTVPPDSVLPNQTNKNKQFNSYASAHENVAILWSHTRNSVQNTKSTFRSLRRLWPATWMAARRYRRGGIENAALQSHNPQSAFAGQVNDSHTHTFDQAASQCRPAWLPLLTLFRDKPI